MIGGFFQFVTLIAQVMPEIMKAWKTWQERHGETLNAETRQKAVDEIKAAVKVARKSKDTSELEQMIKKFDP